MSDTYLYQVPAGQDVAEGLPAIDLPKIEPPPSRRVQITVRPTLPPEPATAPTPTDGTPVPAPTVDPWAAFRTEPQTQPTTAAPETPADPWADFRAEPFEKPPVAKPDVPALGAAGLGAADTLSFGTAPAIAGVHAAGMDALPPDVKAAVEKHGHEPVLGALVAGLARLGYENLIAPALGITTDNSATDAARAARDKAEVAKEAGAEQHPGAFLTGQLGGAVASPVLGALGGVTAAGRIGNAVLAGARGGALYGGGTAISEGKTAPQIVEETGKGAATGGAFGTLGGGFAEGLGKVGSKVASLYRGHRDAETEAARRVVDSLRSDFEKFGPAFTPEELAAANTAGLPRAIVDAGGERTRGLMRSATNVSPEAHQAVKGMIDPRFEDQSPRIAGFIRNLFGGGHADDDLVALQAAASSANRPLYAKAYTAGDRPIWSPELERLTGSPTVERALGGAVSRGKDRAIAEGMGGFNPTATVTPDGRVVFNKGPTGVPTYPNLQFWDYTQRELRDMANQAQRAGRNEEAGALFTLHKQLRAELDKQVPEFASARSTAAMFFGAEDALTAGREFVMSNASIPEARRALAKMSPPERELFARGFASDLADKIERVRDRRNVLDSIFIDTPAAKAKIAMALGPDRARQVEALLRAETVVDEARKAMGNSTTARQLKQLGMSGAHGIAGGGAVATFEAVKEHDFNPAHIITAAITVGAVRHGAHVIDEKVARRVGELLASNDPATLAKGVKIVAASPVLFDSLRRATAAGARVSAHDIGPARSVAGAGALMQGAIGEMSAPHHPHDTLMDQLSQ